MMSSLPDQQKLYYYQIIPDSEVALEKREEAERALNLCRELHQVPLEIKIEWVREVPENETELAEDRYGFEQKLRILTKFDLKIFTGIAGPQTVFKEDVPFYGMTGNTNLKNRILIFEGTPIDRIIFTVAHEFRHVIDFWILGDYWPSSYQEIRRLEERANEFARFMLEKHGGHR